MPLTGRTEFSQLDSDLRSLASRVRTLEEALNQNARNIRPTRGNVPQVSGLSVTQGMGTLRIQFDPSNINDLRKYEIQIDDNSNFSSPLEIETTSTTYVHAPETGADGVAQTTFYVRVRAVAFSRGVGPWASTVQETPGTVTTGDMEVGSATEYSTFTKSSDFTLLSATGTASETYGPVAIDVFDENAVILPQIIFSIDIDSSYTDGTQDNNIVADFLRRPSGGADTTISSVQTDIKSTLPTTGASTARIPLGMVAVLDQPGEGAFEYRLRLTVDSGAPNTLTVQGVDLKMQLAQIKR